MIELNNIQVTFNPGTILENRALKGGIVRGTRAPISNRNRV